MLLRHLNQHLLVHLQQTLLPFIFFFSILYHQVCDQLIIIHIFIINDNYYSLILAYLNTSQNESLHNLQHKFYLLLLAQHLLLSRSIEHVEATSHLDGFCYYYNLSTLNFLTLLLTFYLKFKMFSPMLLNSLFIDIMADF